MAVIMGCVALLLAGVAAVVRWGGLAVAPPFPAAPDAADPSGGPSVGLVVRRYLWYLVLAILSGVGAGLLGAGPGGRLVMRLLAVTAGSDAQGKLTEADQGVGRITVDGTLGFIVFTTLFFGPLWGAAYLLLRRWLPAGRASGLAYGAVLLVAAATRLDPLRRGNPDFDLVGPGMGLDRRVRRARGGPRDAGRRPGRAVSRSVPPLTARPAAVAAHTPLVLLLLRGPVEGLVVVLVGAVVVLATRIRVLAAAWRSRRVVTVGRVALTGAAVAALPGFVSAVVDILGRP
jgi:hypothetical protein